MPNVEPPEPTRLGEVPWLEPYPDALLKGALALPLGPEARYEQTESISLAFVTALENPAAAPAGRPHVLRDVLGFRSGEVADMLGATADSVDADRVEAGAVQLGATKGADHGARPASGPPAHPPRKRRWPSSVARA